MTITSGYTLSGNLVFRMVAIPDEQWRGPVSFGRDAEPVRLASARRVCVSQSIVLSFFYHS